MSPAAIQLVITLFILSKAVGTPIVEGEVSSIERYPWLASVQINGYHHCGGSIVSVSIILTAAHCASYHRDSYTIRVGSLRSDSGGSLHRVIAIKQHENYRFTDTALNDLALMKVVPPLTFGNNVAKIQLARGAGAVAPGTFVTVAGWGCKSEGGSASIELRSTYLHIQDSAKCDEAIRNVTVTHIKSNNLICATEFGGPGFCNGDSGGPLINQDNLQVGITSWFISRTDLRFPGVYVDVARYRSWIDTNSNILRSTMYPGESNIEFYTGFKEYLEG